ncbi:thioredoxin family protein [Lacinutrix sp.]|uniref:thioredoxin family protein n=1 Tax=Lacinutrix sp. TaxID=1937692 RepID=UPI002614E07F|nr:thioredoxin family protein [Lacinutrix sp.]MDG1715953.1 thioredoxin family protein [Lacinutrix sp.]
MKKLQHTNLQNIIKDSLKKAISYQDYRALVKDLVVKESTTGNEKTEDLANYTMLNDRRMKRWDKTVKVDEAVKEKIAKTNINQTWLVLTESWCGDAAHIMPVINKVAELNNTIDFKVVLRDENLDLMNQFLTNGGQSIPKLILIDNATNEVVNTFGPRPSEATKLVLDYKAKHGKLTSEFKEDLQGWYNKDKGQNAISNLVSLL